MLVTTGGTEIAIQSFLRIERELVILKGRLSGSQEQGRIFFIPYCQVDYIGTAQVTKDADFHEMFSSFHFPGPAHEEGLAAMPNEANGYPAAPPVAAPPEPKGGSGVRPAIRSEVLERFRNARGGPPSSSNLPRPPQGS
jgi:hypothetical protein